MTQTTKRGRGRPKKTEASPVKARASGVICAGQSYSIAEFKEITGLGPQGFRDCQEQGLRVVYIGKTGFVTGDDWLKFLADPKRKTRRWDMRD